MSKEIKKETKIATVNFNVPFLDRDGNHQEEKGKKIYIKDLIVRALDFDFQEEAGKIDGNKKFQRFKLANKIYDATGDIELLPEDKVLIKELVGKAFSPLVVGRIYDIINS